LNGMAAASASVPTIFSSNASPAAARFVRRAGAPTVDRALEFAPDAFELPADVTRFGLNFSETRFAAIDTPCSFGIPRAK
jgi:hypothetical protein